jgi:hypothetical protein
MTIFPSFFVNTTGGGYEIDQSLRFDGGSALEWIPSSLSYNTSTWTWSVWLKRGVLGGAGTGGRTVLSILQNATQYHKVYFYGNDGADDDYLKTAPGNQLSNGLYRDPSAWYHLVVRKTGSAAGDVVKWYINGVEVKSGAESYAGSSARFLIGASRNDSSNARFFDGYMAEFNFVEGSSLAPTDFGEPDDNGVWRPKRYTGSYTGNSFYLKFDPSATNGIGHDHSGNGNNFTPTGFTTSGTGTDVFNDTPTNNWVTWNPAYKDYKGIYIPTYSEGNLSGDTAGQSSHFFATQAIQPGDTNGYYFEVTADSIDVVRTYIGLIDASGYSTNTQANGASYQYDYKAILENTGNYFDYASGTSGGNPQGISGGGYGNGDTIMVAYKNGSIWFGKNGTWLESGNPGAGTNAIATDIDTSIAWSPYAGYNSSFTANFGGGANGFQYTVPTGFVALNTANRPAPDIADGSEYFDTVTYTGNGTSQSISSLDFSPDLVWLKCRSIAYNHRLVDSVQGVGSTLSSNLTNAAVNSSSEFTSLDSNGFSITQGAGYEFNNNAVPYVAWAWDAGGTGSSNTDGSITSTVSANPTAGFSIGTFTADGSNANRFHCGVTVLVSRLPSVMVIIKRRHNWASLVGVLSTRVLVTTTTDGSLDSQTLAVADNRVLRSKMREPTDTVLSVTSYGGVGKDGRR